MQSIIIRIFRSKQVVVEASVELELCFSSELASASEELTTPFICNLLSLELQSYEYNPSTVEIIQNENCSTKRELDKIYVGLGWSSYNTHSLTELFHKGR